MNKNITNLFYKSHLLVLLLIQPSNLWGDNPYRIEDTFLSPNGYGLSLVVDSDEQLHLSIYSLSEYYSSRIILYGKYDENLSLHDTAIVIAGDNFDLHRQPDIELGSEQLLLVWNEFSFDLNYIEYKFLSLSYVELTPIMTLSEGTYPKAIYLNDNTYLFAWVNGSVKTQRLLNPQGEVGSLYSFQNDSSINVFSDISMATNASMNPISVSWLETGDLYLIKLSPDGEPLIEPVLVFNDSPGITVEEHNISVLENGLVIIAWVHIVDNDISNVYYQVFNSEIIPQTDPILLTNNDTEGWEVNIDFDDQNRGIIVWDEYTDGGQDFDIYGQRLDPSGEQVGSRFRIASGDSAIIRNSPHVIVHEGMIYTVWNQTWDSNVWGNIMYWDSIQVDIEQSVTNPPKFLLKSVYPNPFNPSTTIKYELSEYSGVSLIVYDITGREVVMLVNRTMQPGRYEARWNGTDDLGKQVAAGMYIVRLQSGNDSKAEKIVCLR